MKVLIKVTHYINLFTVRKGTAIIFGNSYFLSQSVFGIRNMYNVLPGYMSAFQSALANHARISRQTYGAN